MESGIEAVEQPAMERCVEERRRDPAEDQENAADEGHPPWYIAGRKEEDQSGDHLSWGEQREDPRHPPLVGARIQIEG